MTEQLQAVPTALNKNILTMATKSMANKKQEKELLELAAKAINRKLHIEVNDIHHFERYHLSPIKKSNNLMDWPAWNPLTDDGDALRLAIELNMRISIEGDTVYVALNSTGSFQDDDVIREDDIESDPQAATRRAIVRMAAEVGKAIIRTDWFPRSVRPVRVGWYEWKDSSVRFWDGERWLDSLLAPMQFAKPWRGLTIGN